MKDRVCLLLILGDMCVSQKRKPPLGSIAELLGNCRTPLEIFPHAHMSSREDWTHYRQSKGKQIETLDTSRFSMGSNPWFPANVTIFTQFTCGIRRDILMDYLRLVIMTSAGPLRFMNSTQIIMKSGTNAYQGGDVRFRTFHFRKASSAFSHQSIRT